MYEQLKKNTVSAAQQLRDDAFVQFMNPEGKGIRVLFAGNSITLHGAAENIGWPHVWGMAASAKEKDYVHLVMRAFSEKHPNAVYGICQVSKWELRYKNGEEAFPLFAAAREFGADIIIARFVENCPIADFEEKEFKAKYGALLDYLDKTGKARRIITNGFWHHAANDAVRAYAEENGYPFIEMCDLGEKEEMKAIGLFEHRGVANHPGDLGMAVIAERILAKLTD